MAASLDKKQRRGCGSAPLISRILVSPGVRAFWRLSWRPVSASKNSVLGGWAFNARIRGFALPQFGIFEPALQLFGIESERLKLSAPFSRRIAEPLDRRIARKRCTVSGTRCAQSSDHPLAPDPEARLQHFLVDLADTGHRQLGYEFYVLGSLEVVPSGSVYPSLMSP